MAGFTKGFGSFWYNIAYSFCPDSKIESRKVEVIHNKVEQVAPKYIEPERNVDKVAFLIDSIMNGAESLNLQEQFCPVKPGFVRDLVEGAKKTAG